MFSRKSVFSSVGRSAALATVAALALTAIEPSMAFAGAASSSKGLSAAHGMIDNGITDVSARRRVVHRHYRGGGGAAAAAAFAGIVGTGLAIAASRDRDYYDDGYYGRRYYGGPGYYGRPGYYGGGYYGGY